MIEAISVISTTQQGSTGSGIKPALSDVSDFKSLLESPNPVNESVRGFIENAQDQFHQDKLQIDKKLREFETKNSVFALVDAMHVSAMKSVSVQLTGKIGSKVSESFEQIYKQQ